MCSELVAQFTHPLAILLQTAAVLAFLAGTPVLGWFFAVVLRNAAFAFVQERQAERAVEALRAGLPLYAEVLRDGGPATVDAGLAFLPLLSTLSERDSPPHRVPGGLRAVNADSPPAGASRLSSFLPE